MTKKDRLSSVVVYYIPIIVTVTVSGTYKCYRYGHYSESMAQFFSSGVWCMSSLQHYLPRNQRARSMSSMWGIGFYHINTRDHQEVMIRSRPSLSYRSLAKVISTDHQAADQTRSIGRGDHVEVTNVTVKRRTDVTNVC